MTKFYSVFFALLSGISAHAQQVIAIDNLMQYCKATFRFNGVVLIADSKNIIYKNAFGKADFEADKNNGLSTKFRLGSISKQFTGYLIIQLIEEGKLSLDDFLAKYIPAFNVPGKQNITIRNLLTHTSGLADFTINENFLDNMYYNDDSIVKIIARSPLSFLPSSSYSYSNSNFYLLAVISEKLSHQTFAEILHQKVLKKAFMRHSGEEVNFTVNEAKGYIYSNGKIISAPYIEMKNTKGGGGMYSTANDLLKWSQFFQRRLSTDTLLKYMLQPFVLTDGTLTLYSCGWCMMPGFIFHTGHINGFSNLIAIDTVYHRTIILLTNEDYKQLYITMESLNDILQNNFKSNEWLTEKPRNNLAEYRGVYTAGDFKVNITDTLNYLQGETFGQKQYLRWKKGDEFFFLNMDGIVKFERNQKGEVVALKSFQDYSWVTLNKQ